MPSMLQEFLNAQLLPITDDDYFGKLEKVAEAIAKGIGKNKLKIAKHTLAAIDPEVSIDNPEISEVKELISKSWNTFLTNTHDAPLTFVRAVILEALNILSEDNNNGSLIWLTSRNIYKHLRIAGKEEELIRNFITTIGQKIDDKIVNEWSLIFNVKNPKVNIELKELSAATLDRAMLQKLLVWASGPHDEAGTAPIKDPNPHWANAGPPWSYAFAIKASTGISQEVNKSLKEQVKEIGSYQTKFLDSINNALGQLEGQRNNASNLKTELLWWKEAAYSTALKKTYKGMTNGLLQVVMALDYASFVPYAYPSSVDYFLRESHSSFTRSENIEIDVMEALKLIYNSNVELKKILSDSGVQLGRLSLLDFIRGIIWDRFKISDLKSQIGISEKTKITFQELSIWLFHDFEALKILTSK